DRLRLAREAAGLSLADIATRTRVTQRHLQAIENSEFSELPGRTYVTGFARAYARALDLPEAEIAAELRRELDEDEYGARPLYEAYEPTDPARLPTARLTWTLVIIALLLVSAYGVWRFLSVEPDEALIAAQNADADASEAPAAATPAAGTPKAAAPNAAIPANAPVVLTGLSEVWIGFDDATGKTENWRTLDAGETYEVPAAYIEQFTLRTSRPQALKITVGGRDVGATGPADTLVKGISLKPADLVARAEGSGSTATVPLPRAKGAPARP
ncbi:MAG TPA: helix-turn-helix domain-containing protein, partial [Sphingopyxis terrae]|nr:helix-turn-helix domain-containing protein [Sphingopyxis terrae]